MYFVVVTSFGQVSTPDQAMITCFSQGWHGSYATNCASVSTIKLVIAKYGLYKVFLQVDTSADKYVIILRNQHTIELTPAELTTMQGLDKFHFNLNINLDTVQAAKFMYAVMAKNKMIQHPNQYNSLTDAATERVGPFFNRHTVYELNEDTYQNLELLGIDTSKIHQIKSNDIQNYKDIIITSSKHSTYSSFGIYDEYGTPTANSDFSSIHGQFNETLNYILID
jgi:hypothetical protein